MKIKYQDKGSEAELIINSPLWKYRQHFRCVDAAMLTASSLKVSHSHGFFSLRTVIRGPILSMTLAHQAAWRERNKQWP